MWFPLTCLLIFLGAIYKICRKNAGNFPPGPKGIPFLGNIFDLKDMLNEMKFHYRVWNRLAEVYGPVVKIRLGLASPMIIISGREAVVEMLNREEFDGRPDGFLFRHRSLGVRRGVIFTDGVTWKEQRKFSLKVLKDFGYGCRTMEDVILDEATILTKIIAEKSLHGPIKNCNQVAAVAVLNSIWFLTAGTRFDQETEDSGLEDIFKIINDIFKESDVSGGLLTHLPFLRHVIPRLSGFTLRDERQMRIWSFFRNLVSEHKKARDVDNEQRDLIGAYLSEIEFQKSKPSSSFNEAQLIALIKDLFTAGLETTNNNIGFVILYLIVYPKVQMKIHEEIDRVLGRDALPCLQAQTRMPFLNATIAEVSRLSNIGPTSIPHRAIIDTKFYGFDIKKDFIMLANFHSVHMDKEHWIDPEIFRPERFLDENGNFVNDPWLMQFGGGRRKCLGENLAKKSQFLLVSCLLQKFRFELPNGELIPCLEGINGFTISPPNFNAVAVLR